MPISPTLVRTLAVLALTCLLAACAQPVSPEKAAYAGEWKAKDMYLLITAEGNVTYRRQKGAASTSIDAPLQGFDGDDFRVGVGLLRTTFVVSRPPYRHGGQWKMVVDGVELTRSADSDPKRGPPAGDKPPVEMI
jgi:hypothetical protein